MSAVACNRRVHCAAKIDVLQREPGQSMNPALPVPQQRWQHDIINARHDTDPARQVAPGEVVALQARVAVCNRIPQRRSAVAGGVYDRCASDAEHDALALDRVPNAHAATLHSRSVW